MARKPISKKLRFQILERDGFTCQYCGASAPDVVLHVDHIHAVSAGGTNKKSNLTTACQACNLGKAARELVRGLEIDALKYLIDAAYEAAEVGVDLSDVHDWFDEVINDGEHCLYSMSDYIGGGVACFDHYVNNRGCC